MKYTQGEWKVGKSANKTELNPLVKSFAPNGVVRKIIALCYTHSAAGQANITLNEAEANARLISAAPDLFRALQIAIKLLKDSGFTSNDDQVAEGEAAIKKAAE